MCNKSLAEQAYEILKAKIPTMINGTHLSVRNVSAEIGIGYTPVREALLQLERDGCLTQVPKVGFFVRKMTEIEVLHYYQARECIEPFAMRNAFELITDDVVQKMAESCAIQEEALNKGDFSTFLSADIEFHEIPFSLCKNPHLQDFYRTLREKYRLCSPSDWEYSTYPSEIIAEHQQLMKSIRNGDRDASVAAITDHLRASQSRLWKHFKTT